MAKKLSDVLAGTNKSRTRPGSTGTRPGVDYASKMKDERDFVASHEVQEFDDRNGNGSDVFNATNIKHAPDNKHGHVPKPEDEKQYKQANEETSVMDSSPRPMPKPMTSSPRPKKRPIIIGAGSISEPSPNGTIDGSTRGISEENEEKDMMKAQLHFIKYAADEIMGHVDASKDPEEWFQNKLSGLHAGIKDLHAYIEGDKRMKGQVKEEVEQLSENPWNQRLQKKPGTEELPAPPKGSVEKHGIKFKEGDTVVPHTGPHAGVPHKVTYARAGTVNILPMVSVNKHKYDNTTIRAKHEHLSPYKEPVIEDYSSKTAPEVGTRHNVDEDGSIGTHIVTGVADNMVHTQNTKTKEKFSTPLRDWHSSSSPIKEEAEGDPRVEPKDVKSKGKSLKMIVGQVKESNDGSKTKTGTEQARARFDKKMERKEMQKEREEDDH
jgi:hypothetical protein